jgi:hypothetical protein
MPGQSDTFQQGQTATSGPFDGAYLWSNEHNWSTGTIAADGDSIINSASGFNYDDIADLTLASLTQTGDGATYVVAGSLDIDTVSNMGFLGADAFLAGAPVVLTIGAITSSGGDYQAVGAGAELIDNSAADLGNFFGANSGGLIELAGAPASNTTLDYVGSPPGTIALENPGATILGTLENVGVGDVLELPGTSVSSVSFGTDTLSVTTNVGTYTFDHVSYEAGIDSYGASHDATTGLEAITFAVTDTFQQGATATSGQFDGAYLWSNTANWVSNAIPVFGDSVSNAATGFNYDDIAGLTLDDLTQAVDAATYVVAGSLDVYTVSSTGFVIADAFLAGAPVVVTIGMISSSEGDYQAVGTGAELIDNAAADPGNFFAANTGGLVELAGATVIDTTLDYAGAAGTVALENPGSTVLATLENINTGDVLELPGTAVLAVSFGTDTLTVTTENGIYPDITTFDHVSYESGVDSYNASLDPNTGLQAITFGGVPDTFQQGATATGGQFDGAYLWSNTANWVSNAIPVFGDSVSNAATGFNYDDIAGLTLDNLIQAVDAATYVVAGSLDVYTVSSTGFVIADAFLAGAPVVVTIGMISSSEGDYQAVGTGAELIDNSAADPGNFFVANTGGLIELAGATVTDTTLDYAGAAGTVALENPGSAIVAILDNVAVGDVLELPGTSVSNVSFGTSTLSVSTNEGTYTFDRVVYSAAIHGYSVSHDATTGLEAITFALCFCAGSLIRTPSGDVPVEQLNVGDTVVTSRGECRPITWIGVGRVLATRGCRNAATPVIVRKGALGDNVPYADLRVTKGHSFLFDGILIPIEFLVNHRSILWDDHAHEVSVYHVELATHDVLMANGARAESYRDDGNRWLFQNANNAWDLAPQEPCAPVLTGGSIVDDVWRRLLDRAGPRPQPAWIDDPDLQILVDGRRLHPIQSNGARYAFRVPRAMRLCNVRILSRAAAPDQIGLARDSRVLGVAVQSVSMISGARHRTIGADDDRLTEGFHGYEPDLDIRWTDGDAALPDALFEGFDGPADMIIQLGGATRYVATADDASMVA